MAAGKAADQEADPWVVGRATTISSLTFELGSISSSILAWISELFLFLKLVGKPFLAFPFLSLKMQDLFSKISMGYTSFNQLLVLAVAAVLNMGRFLLTSWSFFATYKKWHYMYTEYVMF